MAEVAIDLSDLHPAPSEGAAQASAGGGAGLEAQLGSGSQAGGQGQQVVDVLWQTHVQR